MPYITQARREEMQEHGDDAIGDAHTPGELNYLLTRLCVMYIEGQRAASGLAAPTYAIIAEAVAALECAKLEMYRRIAAPYEDLKRVENGDAYDAKVL